VIECLPSCVLSPWVAGQTMALELGVRVGQFHHRDATEVSVDLDAGPGFLMLSIEGPGGVSASMCGANPEHLPQPSAGTWSFDLTTTTPLVRVAGPGTLWCAWFPASPLDGTRFQDMPLPRPGTRQISSAGDGSLIHLCQAAFLAAREPIPNRPLRRAIATCLQSHFFGQFRDDGDAFPRDRDTLSGWQMAAIEKYLRDHLEQPVSVDSLATISGFSRTYFRRVFTRTTGYTPHRWIMRRRVEYARERLANSLAAISDVALDCGFADQSHLSRWYSAMYGEPPGRARRQCEEPATC
jgi:AraC-like DNA-binding protein